MVNCDRCGKKVAIPQWMLEIFLFCEDCYTKAKKELGYDENEKSHLPIREIPNPELKLKLTSDSKKKPGDWTKVLKTKKKHWWLK